MLFFIYRFARGRLFGYEASLLEVCEFFWQTSERLLELSDRLTNPCDLEKVLKMNGFFMTAHLWCKVDRLTNQIHSFDCFTDKRKQCRTSVLRKHQSRQINRLNWIWASLANDFEHLKQPNIWRPGCRHTTVTWAGINEISTQTIKQERRTLWIFSFSLEINFFRREILFPKIISAFFLANLTDFCKSRKSVWIRPWRQHKNLNRCPLY